MKIETERLENCQMALTIEVDEERTRRALRSVARRISRQANIPGFRPGKAPYNVIAHIIGKDALYQEVMDELGNALYEEALDETGLKPFDQAQITDYETNPLVIKMIVPLAPVVELGDYRQMRLESEEAAVGEEEVNEALIKIQEQNTFWEPSTRPAQWGDLAIADIEGTVKGETVIGNKGRELLLETDSPYPLPGFSEELLGMTVNEQREFTLTYPEEFENDRLAGQQAHFTVHLRDLKEKVVPDIDDDLARTFGSYETLEDLKAELYRELQARAKQEFSNRALTALVERARIEFPPIMLEKEIDIWLGEFDRSLRQQSLNLENYLAMRKLTEDELRKEISPQVTERLKRSLALGKLAELEGLKAESDSIVGEALERLAAIARGELEDDFVETSVGDSTELTAEASAEPPSGDEPSSEEILSEEESESTDQPVVDVVHMDNENERSELAE